MERIIVLLEKNYDDEKVSGLLLRIWVKEVSMRSCIQKITVRSSGTTREKVERSPGGKVCEQQIVFTILISIHYDFVYKENDNVKVPRADKS